MNKWRLLLLSVLSLLQSASTESNFIDGSRRRSSTQLFNDKFYRILKTSPITHQLKVRQDLQNPVSNAESDISLTISNLKYRQGHKISPLIQENKFILTDHQRAVNNKRFTVHTHNDRHLFRVQPYHNNDALPVDIRRNQIHKQNDDRRLRKYFGTDSPFGVKTKDHTEMTSRIQSAETKYKDTLNKPERNFPDKINERSMNYERAVPNRHVSFSSRKNANNLDKLDRGTRDDTVNNKFSSINENGQEMDALKFNFQRQHKQRYESRLAASNKRHERKNDLFHIYALNIKKDDIIRQKRATDTRIKSCVESLSSDELIKKNYHTRTVNNLQYRLSSFAVGTTLAQTNESNNIQECHTLNIRRAISLSQKRHQQGKYIVSRENIHQNKFRKLFARERLRNTNEHSNMLLRIRYVTLSKDPALSPETRHHKISRENTQNNRQAILRRLAVGERQINNIRYPKNINEKLQDTKRVVPLIKERQLFLPTLYLHKSTSSEDIRSIVNTANIPEDRLRVLSTGKGVRFRNTRRETVLTGDGSKIPTVRLAKKSKYNLQDKSQSFSTEKRAKYIRNIRNQNFQNTQHVNLLVRETQQTDSNPVIRYIENIANNYEYRSRRFINGERVINEIRNNHNTQRLKNTRHMLVKEINRSISEDIENTANIQQRRSRSLSTGERVINEFYKKRNIQEKLLNTKRILIALIRNKRSISKSPEIYTENRKDIASRDSSQIFSDSESITNKMPHNRNIQEKRFLKTRYIMPLLIVKEHSISESRVKHTNTIKYKRQDKSRSLSTGKRVNNAIQEKNIHERLLNTRRVTPLIREKRSFFQLLESHIENRKDIRQNIPQRFYNRVRVIDENKHNRNIQERLLNTRLLTLSVRQQHLIPELYQYTENIKQSTTRLSTRIPVTNEIQGKRNTHEIYLNTRRITTPLITDKHSIFHLPEQYKNKIKDIRLYRSQRFSNGERVTNEILYNQNIRKEKLLHTRYITPLVKDIMSISELKERYAENTECILQNKSQNVPIRERLTNKVQNKYIHTPILYNSRERLLNRRHMSPSVREKRYLISKLSRRCKENTKDMQPMSRTTSRGERLNNEIRDNRNILVKRTPIVRQQQYFITDIPKRYIENTMDIHQDRSYSRFTRQRRSNEIRDNLNIRYESLLNMRSASILVTENIDDIRHDTSQSLTVRERVINAIRNNRNTYYENVYNTERIIPLYGGRQYWIRKQSISPWDTTVNMENLRQDRSRSLSTNKGIINHYTKNTEKFLNKEHTAVKNSHDSISISYRSPIQIIKKPTDNTDYNKLRLQTRTPHEVIFNARRKSLLTGERNSYVQLSGNPSSLLKFNKTGTTQVTWQYIFYLLQAIYLCSLCLKIPKENGKLKKKTRFADCFVGMDYMKID